MDRKTGRDVARDLENFVNGASKEDMQEFVSYITVNAHRTLQQRIMGLVVGMIEAWDNAHTKGNFDLRNEATVKLAHKFVEGTGDKYDRMLPYI